VRGVAKKAPKRRNGSERRFPKARMSSDEDVPKGKRLRPGLEPLTFSL